MRKFIVAFLVVFVTLSGCTMFEPITYKTEFSINGFVKDGATRAVLSGAQVSWSGGSKVTTDEMGTYAFGNIANGDYSLVATKAGYTSAKFTAKIDGTSVLIPNLGLREYKAATHVDVTLYPLTGSAKFVLALGDNPFSSYSVSTLPKVKAIMMTSQYDSVLKTMVDVEDPDNPPYDGTINATTGEVTFTALPAAPKMKFIILPFTDDNGNYYAPLPIGMIPKGDGTFLYTDLSLGPVDLLILPIEPVDSLPRVLNHNLDNGFAVAGNLTLLFNKPMDPTLTKPVLDNMTVPASPVSIPLTAAWSTDRQTLTLTPQKALALNTPYHLTGTFTGADGFSTVLTLYDGVDTATDTALKLTTVAGIAYKSSSVLAADYDSNRVSTTAALTVTFDGTIDHLGTVELYQGTVASGTRVQASAAASGNTLTLTPEVSLANDTTYTLHAQVYGAGNNKTDLLTFDDSSVPVLKFTTVKATTTPVKPAAPAISIGAVNSFTTTVPINFTETAGSTSYRAYARVTDKGDWILVGTVDSQVVDFNPLLSNPASIATSISAILGAVFDKYKDDSVVTPFAGSQSINFKVVGYSTAYGEGDDSNVKSVTDGTPPAATSTTPSVAGGSWAVGTYATATNLTFTVIMDEYISATAAPTATVSNMGATPTPTVSAPSFNATNGRTTFTVNVAIPATTTLTNTAAISFNVNDTSTNSKTVTIGFTTLNVGEIR